MRVFDSGATRDGCEHKLSYAGFFSPWVLQRFAKYMHMHRFQTDGQVRASDNWKKGIPQEQYLESLLRHTFDVWLELDTKEPYLDLLEDHLCGVMFNSMGLLYEILRTKGEE